MRIRIAAVGAALFLLAGCTSSAPPVALVGSSSDLQQLAGNWHGTFRNTELKRGGQIDFRMSAATDSAYGEVTMYTERPDQPIWNRPPGVDGVTNSGPSAQAPVWMRIRFVRVEGGYVSGQMEPVFEPRCNCWTMAKFIGRLKDGHMEGSYTSRSRDGLFESSGSWQADRTGDYAP